MPLSDFNLAKVAMTATDPRRPDNPIVDCNEAFLKLTGYDRDEVIGRNCRFLAGPETEPEQRRLLREAIDEERPVMVELLNYRKDGTRFMNAVMVVPVYGDEGDLIGFLGSQVEVTPQLHPSFFERRRKAKEAVSNLSPRQSQILRALTEGKAIKQVAFELELSERTIKMHRAAMLKSLGASTNAEAIRLAVEANL